jgi:hypothetical protein
MSYCSNPTLTRIAERLERLEKPVVSVLAVAGGYFTFEGLAAIHPGGDQMVDAGAALFAGAMGSGLFLGWSKAFSSFRASSAKTAVRPSDLRR